MSDNLSEEQLAAFAKPKRPNRKAWKEKEARGTGRTGKPIPPKATEKEVKAYMQQMAKEAIAVVVDAKPLPAEYRDKYESMSWAVKNKIKSILGDDVEAAKQEFVQELYAYSREVIQHIMTEWKDYHPAQKLYLASTLVDKAQALGTKAAASAAGAHVGQVNVFMDGSADKEKIIAQLTGAAFGLAPEKPEKPAQQPVVEVPVDVPTGSAS